jgi:signal transduction histidine kinase
MAAKSRKIAQPFRPRARVLQLLGDELIGNPRLAVFELVKNAYDADASKVTIRLDFRKSQAPLIRVTDNGAGMSLHTIRSIWLVPGDDHRQKQRAALERSLKHGRLPLGEKGLGRFAVHKLGNNIRVTTRAKGEKECFVEIDWNKLVSQAYLDQAPVTIAVRNTPTIFKGNATGTRISIRELRPPDWTRGEVRRLYNQITSICSPFDSPDAFAASVEVPGHEDWIENLPDVNAILNRAIWKFSFKLSDGDFSWKYEFRGVPGMKLDKRSKSASHDILQLPKRRDDHKGKKIIADAVTTTGIGPVSGNFFVYDREKDVLRTTPNSQVLTDYLDDNGGVRVYRDGIRVYNYGEAGDDWLGLDLRRVNIPTRRISRNIILGAIHLSLADSKALVEKTNREGFVDNDASDRLQQIVLGALATLEAERQIDKERIRKISDKVENPLTSGIEKPIAELRRALDRRRILEDFEPYVTKIETDYLQMQQTLLQAGLSGLNLAVIFHEVEHGVRALHTAITQGTDRKGAEKQAQNLMNLLDGFSGLLRRDTKRRHTARSLVDAARDFNLLRFGFHQIELVSPLLRTRHDDFAATFTFNLVLGALNNLIDNALYWLRIRWPEARQEGQTPRRRLYIGASTDFEAGPAIIVADNGPGFQVDDTNQLARPFFSRRPAGMGLGLYYANLAMELNGGQLVFPDHDAVELPNGFDGAVAALIFKPDQ